MTFLMLTYVSEAGAAAYEDTDPDQQVADRILHNEWFAENSAALRGGYELAWPRRTGRIAHDQQLLILDGPFADTKEALGGVIVLEAGSLEAACEIARTWPSLNIYPGAKVEVVPVSEALEG
jgi:hypothetical protein